MHFFTVPKGTPRTLCTK